MVRACPGGFLLIDVDPLPGMTPGVAQFYRRCIVAGTRRADGAVVCGSQKELALLFQLSQGTVASHVSALQAARLVVQRVPVLVLASDGQAALAEPVNAEPASLEDAIVKLAAVIGSCPSSAAIAQLGQALITLATERDASRDRFAINRDLVATSTDSEKTQTFCLNTSESGFSERETAKESGSLQSFVAVAAGRGDAMSSRDAWPMIQEMIAKAAQAAGLAPDTWVPDGRPQLKQYCFKFSGPQLLHAGRRIAAQLLDPKKFVRINNPWAVLATAAKDRDLSYFPPECELAELEARPPVSPGPDALTNEPDPNAPVLRPPSAEERQRAESLVAVMAGAGPSSHRGGHPAPALAGIRQALRAPVGYDGSFTRQFRQAVTADPFAPTEDCQVSPSQSP
jgi:hypothetical protein